MKLKTILGGSLLLYFVLSCAIYFSIFFEQKKHTEVSEFIAAVSKQRTLSLRITQYLFEKQHHINTIQDDYANHGLPKEFLLNLDEINNLKSNPGFRLKWNDTQKLAIDFLRYSQALFLKEDISENELKILYEKKTALVGTLSLTLATSIQPLIQEENNLRILSLSLFSFYVIVLILFWFFSYRPLIIKYEKSQALIHQHYEEVNAKNNALLRSNQELDRFAYIISHDLKSPLRAIHHLSEWIQEDKENQLTPDSILLFEKLKNRVNRLEMLINGILEYSRIGRTDEKWEYIPLKPTLDSVVTEMRRTFSFDLEIAVSIEALYTQPFIFKQILEHLVHNALTFNDKEKALILISDSVGPEFYTLSFLDNGPGIPDEFRTKIFEMFQTLQTRDQIESAGVGLAIVKKGMLQLMGDVSISDDLPQGTQVNLHFPLSAIENAS